MRNPVLIRLVLGTLCAGVLLTPAGAQTAAASSAAPSATPSATPSAASPAATRVTTAEAATPASPAAEGAQWVRKVSEDDHVRIEEVKSRGETLRVTVRLKGSGREYDIVPPSAAQDPSQRHKTPAGSALFRLLSF